MKAFSQKDPTRAVSAVALKMETDEWIVRKSHQTLFHGKQIQEKRTGLYALGDETNPGILRQILIQFTDAERKLLQEEGHRLSTLIPRRRTVRLSQTA